MSKPDDFAIFLQRRLETELATEKLGSARSRLAMARIKERFAEVRSQDEPLDSLLKGLGHPVEGEEDREEARDSIVRVLRYLVMGGEYK